MRIMTDFTCSRCGWTTSSNGLAVEQFAAIWLSHVCLDGIRPNVSDGTIVARAVPGPGERPGPSGGSGFDSDPKREVQMEPPPAKCANCGEPWLTCLGECQDKEPLENSDTIELRRVGQSGALQMAELTKRELADLLLDCQHELQRRRTGESIG